jgi:outer membrane biosynthesis protein TonB
MRKFTLIISILCLLATFALAQKTMRKKISFPIKQKVKVVDSPLQIINQPKANYPKENGGSICVNGIVRLKVEFLEDATIGKISIISSLPYGLNEQSIEAAKKIKFKPAMKDGKPIKVSKIIEYRFKEF